MSQKDPLRFKVSSDKPLMLQSFWQVLVKLSFKQLFTVILFSSILFLVLRPITDADFWWHLATGRWMAETSQIPRSDPFAYTTAGNPWIAHEWLTEKGMYELYEMGGFPLLILFFSLLITSAYVFTYFRFPIGTRPYIAGFVLLLAAVMSAPLWGVRPQMLTVLFSSIFLYLLDRYEIRNQIKYLVCLPVLMLAWVNLHAGYFIGLVILGIYLSANLLKLVVNLIKKEETVNGLFQRTYQLILCLTVSILAALINPQGAKILLYPFETLTDPAMQLYIQEWYPPDFRQLIWLPFFLGLILTIVFGVLERKKISIPHFFLLLVFGILGLRSMRHVPLFAVVSAPILATFIQGTFPATEKLSVDGRKTWFNTLLVLFFLIPVGLRFFQVNEGQVAAEKKIYPTQAVEWIKQQRPGGNLFNSYTWGGYLIWKLSPDIPVFIDGRADLYGPVFFTKYAGVYQGFEDYRALFSKYRIRYVLVEPDSGIAEKLLQSDDWSIGYEDEISIVLISK